MKGSTRLETKVKTSEISHADTNTDTVHTVADTVKDSDANANTNVDSKNMTATRLTVLTAAEQALKAKIKENIGRIVSSSEQSVPISTLEERIKTDQLPKDQKQKQSESITGSEPDVIPSKLVHAHDKQTTPKKSEQVGDIKDSQSEAIKVIDITGQQQHFDKKDQQTTRKNSTTAAKKEECDTWERQDRSKPLQL